MEQAKKTFTLYDAAGDLTKNWFVYWYEQGKRQRKYGDINKGKTDKERRQRADKLISVLQLSVRPDTAASVQKAKIQAVLDAKKNTLRKKSFQSYQSKINKLFEFAGSKEIDNNLLEDFFLHISREQAPGTVHDAFFTIKRILAGEGLEYLLRGISPPAFQAEPKRYFQRYQIEQLAGYMASHDPGLLLWCKFVYYCFLRPRSELRLLKIQDIYFHQREIIVPGNIAKNKKTEAIIIPDAFWPDVAPLQLRKPGEYIFPGKNGNPTGHNTMGNKFVKVLEVLGYDTSLFSLYSWKHTGAVELYRATKDLVGLQAQLRHHSLDQVKQYLRQLHVSDFPAVRADFPALQ